LNKDLKEKGKKYFQTNLAILGLLAFIFFTVAFGQLIFASPVIITVYFFTIFLTLIFFSGAILIRFKGNYYVEYQKWKAFKRYLKNSFSIKTATHKTLVIWKEYLIYATALGVPERVIKELKHHKIINAHQQHIYTSILVNNSGFASVYASSGGAGGGFGGAGGGGVGGGGGGGR
jgi:uncharacterized membrane protein